MITTLNVGQKAIFDRMLPHTLRGEGCPTSEQLKELAGLAPADRHALLSVFADEVEFNMSAAERLALRIALDSYQRGHGAAVQIPAQFANIPNGELGAEFPGLRKCGVEASAAPSGGHALCA
ncbi:hypothetical protein WKW77_10085 [Variovorax ureilyticus]|uniref:Uncharacterized protein n=1 Tax=Variovorax ureilyticus TaxID=1836198 RepID=A0ABU8VES4_9BURK